MKLFALILAFLCSQSFAVEVVNLATDARFDEKVAKSGMSAPKDFTSFGLYSTAPLDSSKEVVLFVHGANGSPRDFAELADKLNASQQQAMFVYFASGNSVAQSGEALSQEVLQAMTDSGITRIRVVAHSMGGLVAWHLVKALEAHVDVKQFVTVSTPWNGHWGARLGTWFSFSPRDSWRDLSPGSGTLQAIWSHKLKTPHTVVFTLTEDSDQADGDGTISRESQLVPAMQSHAVSIVKEIGTHMSVLRGPSAVHLVSLISQGLV